MTETEPTRSPGWCELLLSKKARAAFIDQRSRAIRRGVGFSMSWEEWTAWWAAKGRWALRGKSGDKLCMCRKGDAGSYRFDNIYCASSRQNVSDFRGPRRSEACRRAFQARTPEGKNAGARKVNASRSPEEMRDILRKARAVQLPRFGAENSMARAVVDPDGHVWPTGRAAAKALAVYPARIHYWCSRRRNGWRYADDI
jgi:hypothetical protein